MYRTYEKELRRLRTELLSRITALTEPAERGRTQWHLWYLWYFPPYAEHLPAAGETVPCDRFWCDRAGVDRPCVGVRGPNGPFRRVCWPTDATPRPARRRRTARPWGRVAPGSLQVTSPRWQWYVRTPFGGTP
ncbi:hypothetical protein [Streptomyces sp. HGB0020]|uniref:hypothetical protein n=1 Tax=Streptomyces sp. HGB0020 TaxID=1078086 RepID=UPI003B631ABC